MEVLGRAVCCNVNPAGWCTLDWALPSHIPPFSLLVLSSCHPPSRDTVRSFDLLITSCGFWQSPTGWSHPSSDEQKWLKYQCHCRSDRVDVVICSGGRSSSFHFEGRPHSGQNMVAAWRLFQSSTQRHTAKSVVFMWPICGGAMYFSTPAGLRKVTVSESVSAVRVCGRVGPEELWVKILTFYTRPCCEVWRMS